MHLIVEQLVSLPVPPVQHEVNEGLIEFLHRLCRVDKPEARAHAGINIGL